jgi:CBS domain-containing protein
MRKMGDIIRNQIPLTLTTSTTVHEAARHMREREVGAVLVVGDDSRLIGIFTGRDAISRVLAEGKNPRRTTLAEVMTINPDTMPSTHRAIEALRLMQDAHYRHLPIVDDGRVVGIVSRGDFRGSELDRLDEETGLWERL